jgi:simple sugar transport system substrate-binding protein
MKKSVIIAVALMCGASLFAAPKKKAAAGNGKIKIGVINNPPSESGYRAANVKDMEDVFSAAKGYDVKTYYSMNNDEQLNAFSQFVTDGVDYILLSPADMAGWSSAFKKAQKAGVKVFLFDRLADVKDNLYEAAVVSDMPKEGESAVAWLKAQKLKEYKVIHLQGHMGSAAQIGRTGALDKEFAAGTMKKVVQQTADWSADNAKKIVESVINQKEDFNVIYAENDDMAKGAVAALDEAGITHGVNGKVIIMGFDTNKWALRELLAGRWNYDGQCSPFQAAVIENMIKSGKVPSKIIYNDEKGFDAKTIKQSDIDTYGLGD